MLELRPARESEVVLAFLRAEIESPQQYAGSIQIVLQKLSMTRQELTDDGDPENDLRKCFAGHRTDAYRGYLKRV